MQWRTREEDGWADQGRGQVGRQGKRMGGQTREEDGQADEGRQVGEEDRDIVGGLREYLNRSWT